MSNESNYPTLDLANKKYFFISTFLCLLFSIALMVFAQIWGLNVDVWWPLFFGVYISLSYWGAAYLAQKRYKKLKSELEPQSGYLKKAEYIGIKSKYKALINLIFPVATIFPIFIPKLSEAIPTYMIACCIGIRALSGAIAVQKAKERTGYIPPSAWK